jgi:hypothetical protein
MSEVNIIGIIESKTLEIQVEVQGTGPRGPQGPPGETYIHPDTHPAAMIMESEERVFLSNQEKTALLNFTESYVHDQLSSSAVWIVMHNLNKYPNVTILDSAGTLVIGEIEYISKNSLILRFAAEFSGKAYLS